MTGWQSEAAQGGEDRPVPDDLAALLEYFRAAARGVLQCLPAGALQGDFNTGSAMITVRSRVLIAVPRRRDGDGSWHGVEDLGCRVHTSDASRLFDGPGRVLRAQRCERPRRGDVAT